ncbi:amino acid ABC transporter permease [uncultured Anaerofustis sp.]|uniref:amino acid ABC transporter permease n=1 Tax=uncultured Anaerofustis sp. TaxID=904996 RepID=UPI0025D1DBD6|nr:amino acid ABC transporter permease [uncultured Anaerofustis sp.]
MNFLEVFSGATPLLLEGLAMTVQITIISLIIAFFLGLFSCVMGISSFKPFKAISKFYLWLIRGTPLLVQCFFVYFGLPQLIQSFGIDFRLTAYSAGIITLSLNAGAYMSEIFRGGIQAVDKGQMEAARSLGLPKGRAMIKVILPQALKICIPSLVNQFIITLKDTSIISTISLAEVVYAANIYIGRTMNSFATWTLVGLMYLVVVTALSSLSNYIERRISNE